MAGVSRPHLLCRITGMDGAPDDGEGIEGGAMSFVLKPAVRENVPLLIGLAGGTGSGKTYSAMRLAKGLAGGQKFAVIDTESGRARAYADEFQFDSGEL